MAKCLGCVPHSFRMVLYSSSFTLFYSRFVVHFKTFKWNNHIECIIRFLGARLNTPHPDCYSDSTGEWIFPPYQSQQTRRCFSLVVAWSCSTRHTGRWGRPAGSPHWGPGHCCSVPLQRTNHSVFSISPPQTS